MSWIIYAVRIQFAFLMFTLKIPVDKCPSPLYIAIVITLLAAVITGTVILFIINCTCLCPSIAAALLKARRISCGPILYNKSTDMSFQTPILLYVYGSIVLV